MDLSLYPTAKEEEIAWLQAKYRSKEKEEQAKKRWSLLDFCTTSSKIVFQEQLQFIQQEDRFKTLCKSRRAGGTMSLVGLFFDIGRFTPDINMAYITLDRGTAERIIWPELMRVNQDKGMGCQMNQQKLWIDFPNRSKLYLAGAKDRNEINKLRGKAFYIIAIDECQSFRDSLMKELIEDVLEASLIDYGGRLLLVGTPNAACAGYFYEACHANSWKHFGWTMEKNPWIPIKSGMSVEQIKQEHLARKCITEDDASYQREWLGKWVKDENSLVFKFNKVRNTFDVLPEGFTWHKILSADIGWHDHDAICIWAFTEDLPNLYLIYCEESTHQDITGFAQRVHKLEEEHGAFMHRVIDTGGLGKKVTEELKNRHSLYFKAADKTQKHSFIKLMNADFLQGTLKVQINLPIIEDLEINQWDMDKDPPFEDARFSWDLTDAALYGWREAKHYTYEKKASKPVKNSIEELEKEWNKVGQEIQKRQGQEWWEQI